MRRFSALLVLVCVMLCVFSGCGKYKQIKVTDFNIESLSIVGLRSANLSIRVIVDNPAGKLDVREFDGHIKYFGKVIGKVTLNPFIVGARTNRSHLVTARIDLSRDVGLGMLYNLFDKNLLSECEVDIHVKGHVGILPIHTTLERIPLKKLLEL